MKTQGLASMFLAAAGDDGFDLFRSPSQSGPTRAEISNIHQFLNSLSTFSKLSKQEIEDLAAASRLANFSSGEYVSLEGDDASSNGFIVVSGRLAMTKSSINGKDLVVQLLGPGDCFGLILLLPLSKSPIELSARAQVKSEVLWIPIELLVSFLDRHPELYRDFITNIIHSLQSSYRIARGLAHDRVEVRIASILLSLGLNFARGVPPAQANTIDITRQQVADLVGTTPETAIRVTRAMQRDGLIDIQRPKVISLLDIEGLHLLADGE